MERIRSIEQLEILLLLRHGSWSASDVYQVVRSSERSVQDTLDLLHRQGLLKKSEDPTPMYRFEPASQEMRALVEKLAHFYTERRVRVVEAIYSERTSEMDEFAKAFRLRKDSNG